MKTKLISLALLAMPFLTFGQTFTVEQCEALPFDFTAKTKQVKDLNDKPCALIKVWAVDDLVEVQGNNIGAPDKTGSESRIYVTDGTKEMRLLFANHLPVEIYFPDYGIKNLESKETYLVVLSDPNAAGAAGANSSTQGAMGVYYTNPDANNYYLEGMKYLTGGKVKQNLNKAKELLLKAGDAGNPDAQYQLGCMYLDGVGFKKDLKKAGVWFEKAASAGKPDAMFELGRLNLDSSYPDNNARKGLDWLTKAAEAGSVNAMNDLGYYYSKGKYVAQDPKKAVEWYTEAAERGHAMAQYNLALKYVKGEGVTKDDTKAFEWFERGAKLGDPYAQYNLGICYQKGQGTAPDSKMAVEWLRKAANQGHFKASEALFKLGK